MYLHGSSARLKPLAIRACLSVCLSVCVCVSLCVFVCVYARARCFLVGGAARDPTRSQGSHRKIAHVTALWPSNSSLRFRSRSSLRSSPSTPHSSCHNSMWPLTFAKSALPSPLSSFIFALQLPTSGVHTSAAKSMSTFASSSPSSATRLVMRVAMVGGRGGAPTRSSVRVLHFSRSLLAFSFTPASLFLWASVSFAGVSSSSGLFVFLGLAVAFGFGMNPVHSSPGINHMYLSFAYIDWVIVRPARASSSRFCRSCAHPPSRPSPGTPTHFEKKNKSKQ